MISTHQFVYMCKTDFHCGRTVFREIQQVNARVDYPVDHYESDCRSFQVEGRLFEPDYNRLEDMHAEAEGLQNVLENNAPLETGGVPAFTALLLLRKTLFAVKCGTCRYQTPCP